jgi:HD-GYP domain-containing protein (c-di-GMP phosphodiesterase class II)
MLRIAELLGALSLATDLADGFALEKSLRTAVLARRLADCHGCDATTLATTFWSSLLRFTGCTGFSHEEARYFAAGEDIALRQTLAMVDFGRPSTFVRRAVGNIARHAPLPARAAALGRLLGPGAPKRHALAQCEAGTAFARAVEMPDVAEVLNLRDERWDGRGPRQVAAAEALPLAARIADVADTAELFAWNHGPEVALDELRRRRGGQLDPQLVDRFVREAPGLWADLFGPSVWDLFLAAEPTPLRIAADDAAVARCLLAFARFSDLFSVYTLGHAVKVAALVERAAAALDLPEATRALARNAGYVHDVGRVGVPNGIWEKPGALSPYERERVRAHTQHTETALRLAPALAGLADVACAAHERGGGAGYHRRLQAESIPAVARLLAAADVCVALESDRPHRPAFSRGACERELRAMVAAGGLDATAVDAVLAAAGHRAPPLVKDRALPRGLTEREVEVIRLVAVGRTNPEIGRLLGISPRTAQKHVMNVYEKLGLESRAGLALFAMEHGLLDPPG